MAGSESKDEKGDGQAGSMTRRGFLKGAGLTAAGAAIVEGGLLGVKEAAAAEPRVVGPGLVLGLHGLARLDARVLLHDARVGRGRARRDDHRRASEGRRASPRAGGFRRA